MNTLQKTSLKTLHLEPPFSQHLHRTRRSSGKVVAVRRDHHERGKLVDENMIVLRMRIQAMKVAEASHAPPANWMEWEKKWYPNYHSDVFEAIGLLQNFLMDSRPSFVVGLVALMIVSGSTSFALLLTYFVDIFKRIN